MKNWMFFAIMSCFGLLTEACTLPIPPWEELAQGETAKVYLCGDPGKVDGTYLNATAFAYQIEIAIKDIDTNLRNSHSHKLFQFMGILPDAFYGTEASRKVDGRCVFWIPRDRSYPTREGMAKLASRDSETELGLYDYNENGKPIFIFFTIDPCPGEQCAWQDQGSNVSDVVEHEFGHANSLPHPEDDSSGLLSKDTPGIMSIKHHTRFFAPGDLLNTCINGADSCDPNYPGNSARTSASNQMEGFSAVID